MVYKYKDKSDAAKVHSAPATERRVSYSRADNKTYRNTGGASTRAGAVLRAKQTFGVPGTDGAEKKKSRKKRLIKRFAIATAVRTINDKKAAQRMVPLRRAVQCVNSLCGGSARPLLCEPKPQQRKKQRYRSSSGRVRSTARRRVRHLRCTVQRGIKQEAAYTARHILHRQRYALYSSVKPLPPLIMRGCGKLLRSAAKRVCATASRRAKLV